MLWSKAFDSYERLMRGWRKGMHPGSYTTNPKAVHYAHRCVHCGNPTLVEGTPPVRVVALYCSDFCAGTDPVGRG